MDRASCLNLNTRSFKHRSPSRIQIIARPQAWSQKRVAPGDPIELTNATEASSLTPQAAARFPYQQTLLVAWRHADAGVSSWRRGSPRRFARSFCCGRLPT